MQNPEVFTGHSAGLWSSVGTPSVIKDDGTYKMWYTQGISSFTVGNVLDILLGTNLSLGYAYYTVTAPRAITVEEEVDYEAMDPEEAAELLAEMDADEAVDILVDMDSDNAADILREMDPEDAATILEEMDAEDTANILEQMDPDDAAAILEETDVDTTADILEEMDSEDAAAVMEELSTDKLSETTPEMSEASLTERLPGLSPHKLFSLDPQLLFDSLPNAYTEQLISEDPPQLPPEAEAPIVVYTTPSGARYLAIRTWAGEWVIVIGTPIPVDKLLIKIKRALENVETTVEVFDELPADVAGLPAGQLAMAYFNISLKNITPEDIELGHMTFKVEKEWLENNSIHKWLLALNRYDRERGQWLALLTKRIEEDGSFVYYTSPITRFSIFAISGSEDVLPRNFQVANLALNPAEAKTGQDITTTADITNLSDEARTYVATLWIDGTVEAGQEIFLNPKQTKAVLFTVTRDIEGDYQVRLDRLFDGFSVIKVVEAPAAFTVSNLSITPAEVYTGEEVTITVLVTNTGDLSGSYRVVLKIDAVAIASKEVTLAGGTSETVTFTTTKNIAGSYSVTVDGLSGTFEVKTKARPIKWWLIILIAAVTAAIAVPLYVIRRRRLA